jgi:hypothetical protein
MGHEIHYTPSSSVHSVKPAGQGIHLTWYGRSAMQFGAILGGYHSRVLLVGDAYLVLVLTNVISGVSSPGFEPVISTLCQHRAYTRDVADTQGRMEAQTKRHYLLRFWGTRLEPCKLERHRCYYCSFRSMILKKRCLTTNISQRVKRP